MTKRPALLLSLALAAAPLAAQAEPAVIIPPPAAEAPAQNSGLGAGLETAVLAGGCFWGIQAVYQILQIFFSVAHDPTQLNRQGPDTGPHYRSEIFPQNEAQAQIAKAYIAQLDAAKAWKRPIVTRTGTMKATFFPAEAYHQDYAVKHPYQPYIVFNDAPKVENLKKAFPDVWRDQPVLVSQAAKTN
jgi:peptide-methionine (S)-S-oxide reductase